MKQLSHKTDIHLARKALHLGLGLLLFTILSFCSWQQSTFQMIFAAISLTGCTLEFLRLRHSSFNSYILSKVAPFARAEETKRLSGLSFFFLGVTFACTLVSINEVRFLVLILAIADPIAALLGSKYGKKKLIKNKTWMGSISFFITSFLLIALVPLNLSLPILLGLAIIATLAEIYPLLDDNLSILGFSAIYLKFMSIL